MTGRTETARPCDEHAPTVVFTTRIFSPEPSAASLRLSSLATELADRGAAVRILTTTPGPNASAESVDQRLTVRRLPALRDRSGYLRGYLQYLSFDVPLLLRVLFGRAADVYVCEPPPTTGLVLRIAAALRRRPYVYYAADIWSDAARATGASRVVLRAVRRFEAAALRGAAAVLAVTEGVRDRVAELAPTVPVAVVGHGADLRRFTVDGPWVDEPADVVYVGTASEWHGAELAMRALAQVMQEDDALTAAFIGQGSSWSALQEIAAQHGLGERIRFFGPVPSEEAAAWLRSARLSIATLAPGQGYDFAVPTKLYSSLAVGTRVVYAGPDPVRGMIRDGGLGAASAYDVAEFAGVLRTELSRATRAADTAVSAWARQNVSSETVAARAADVVLNAVRHSPA